jgi:hypothetical protein
MREAPAGFCNKEDRVRTLFFSAALLSVLAFGFSGSLAAQSLGNAGTVEGVVTDPSGAAIPGADVRLQNPVTGYRQAVVSNSDGKFRLVNIPPNQYHLSVTASRFAPFGQDVAVRSSLPIEVNVGLVLGGSETTVNVESSGADLVELVPSAHIDSDRSQFSKIPAFDPGGGLSQAITYSTGGVAADANGFFHPLGDHAQVSFVVDGQPISDQQSKVFSTQLPTSAIQSMELITGAPNAEFGDKSSLVDQITTRSALGSKRMFGSVESYYGSFGNVGGDVSFGVGNEKFGNFIALDGTRSGRFLDTPEQAAFHDKGNNQTIFDRLDYQPTGNDVFHLNLFAARNWIQIPNSYDQLPQDQRQRVMTWNIAPGYQHTFNAHYLLTINPYIRKDQFIYYPSRDLLNDTPSTQSQNRQLLNYGVRSDLAINVGRHNIKIGVDLKQTRLQEEFAFGITDPGFNAVCQDSSGAAIADPTQTNPEACAALGFQPNQSFQAGLLPFDLTRGGSLFTYRARHNINQYATYIQDSITLGPLLLSVGLRGDTYYGLTADSAASPRVGLAYNIKQTGTVLRAAYSRTFETPFNENLLLSSATGLTNGIAESVLGGQPAVLPAGHRNQFNVGFQQAIGKYILIDADYFWKFTRNAYDFSTLQNTTITFPISWAKSKLDGVTGRVSTTDLHGFQAYWTFGHTRARYFPDQTGGLINQGDQPSGVFRIDHDQAFQSTVLARYQRPHEAEWISFSWRYDSGLVAGINDVADALTLTAAQQVAIGFSCDGVFATYTNPITTCVGVGRSKLLTLPQIGQENDDHNPDRVQPRHLFNLALGTDNLFHVEGPKRFTARLEVENLTDKVALYNFLSTFSGTHFLSPRSVIASVGYRF